MKVYVKNHNKIPHHTEYFVFSLDNVIDPGCIYEEEMANNCQSDVELLTHHEFDRTWMQRQVVNLLVVAMGNGGNQYKHASVQT
jgi:hypothetical protein